VTRRTHRGVALPAALALLMLAAVGCAPPKGSRSPYEIIAKQPATEVAQEVPNVTQAEWTVARSRLSRLRSGRPTRPFVERVHLAISDPRTGREYEARGAVAINPGRAARMILIGPGGTTALDVWVTKERFRFAVPAIKLEKRGGTDPNESKGLPIGMLRWWFLSPLAGRVLLARSTAAESAWILRDGAATVTVRSDGRRFVALRREGETLEGIEWLSRGLVPQQGEHGRYIEGRFGLRVDVIVEEVLTTEPEPEAFSDPDEAGTAL
jgi:hypothetical protein